MLKEVSLYVKFVSINSYLKNFQANGEEHDNNSVVLRKTTASAKDVMNDNARAVLSKTEMSSLTYYISQYEHKQINIDELTINLLQLLNTNEKVLQ